MQAQVVTNIGIRVFRLQPCVRCLVGVHARALSVKPSRTCLDAHKNADEAPPPPNTTAEVISNTETVTKVHGGDLLYQVNKATYFRVLSVLATSQLSFWSWYKWMDVYYPVAVTDGIGEQLGALAPILGSNLWGQFGLGVGMLLTGLVPFYASRYIRTIVALPGEQVRITYHTALGFESSPRVVYRSQLITSPEKAADATFFAINVGGDWSFSLLDKKGEIFDTQRLMRLINHRLARNNNEEAGSQANQNAVDEIQQEASEAARKRLQEMSASAPQVQLKKDRTPKLEASEEKSNINFKAMGKGKGKGKAKRRKRK